MNRTNLLWVWLPWIALGVLSSQQATAQISIPTPDLGSIVPDPSKGVPCPPGVDKSVCGTLAPDLPARACHGLQLPSEICPPSIDDIAGVIGSGPPEVIANFLIDCLTTKCPDNLLDAAKRRLSGSISEKLANQLRDRANFWEGHARYCLGSYQNDPKYKSVPRLLTVPPFPGKEVPDQIADDPTRPHACDDHDMALFNGLLCYVGDQRGCDAVKRSQAEDGSWWRSPKIIGIDRNVDPDLSATMSEEQTWGVFLYLIRTGDKAAFGKWTDWIARNRPCLIGDSKSCKLRGLPIWCSDARKDLECNFLPYECMLFENLARRFDSNPMAAINVSRKIGCDLVMGAVYGAAAGVLGTLAALLGQGIPAVLQAVPALLLASPDNRSMLQNLASSPPSPSSLPLSIFGNGMSPDAIAQQLNAAPVASGPQNLCAKDLADIFGIKLPPLPNDGCIIPPLPFSPLPMMPFSLGASLPGFTTGYPVGKQLLAEALVTDPGYGLHKVGVKIYILQQIGLADPDTQRAGAVVAGKSAGNAFFSYLAGRSKEAADEVLNKCPSQGGIQPANRQQWTWEREESDMAWLASSYWDCIFATKMLTRINSVTSPIFTEMQAAQSEAVRSPYSKDCKGFESTIDSGDQSAPDGNADDALLAFPDDPDTTFKWKHWYRQHTFIAPCSGWYSVLSHMDGPEADHGMKLVGTWRYAEPIPLSKDAEINQFQEKVFYIDQYEGLSAVFPAGGARSLTNFRLWITWLGATRSGHADASSLLDRDSAKIASWSSGSLWWKGDQTQAHPWYQCPALLVANDAILTFSRKSCPQGTFGGEFDFKGAMLQSDIEPVPVEESDELDYAIYKLHDAVSDPSLIANLSSQPPGKNQYLGLYSVFYGRNHNKVSVSFACQSGDKAGAGFIVQCSREEPDWTYSSFVYSFSTNTFLGFVPPYSRNGHKEAVGTWVMRESSDFLKSRAKWN